MKSKFFTSLFTTASLFSAVAQPVFTLDNLVDGNKLLTYKTAYIDGGLGPMGPDQQWDFSYFDGEEGFVLLLGDLSNFPELNAPQDANKVLIKSNNSNEPDADLYNFLKADMHGLERLSYRADGIRYTPFSAPYKELIFPVEFNEDQVLTKTTVSYTEPALFNENDSVKIFRSIELYYSVPGYGTINLPGNTSHELLLIQRLETVRDSIEIYTGGVWTPMPSETSFNEFYDFLSPSLGYYVMMAEMVESAEGSAYNIYYLQDIITTGVNDPQLPEVTVFPNPARKEIFINGLNKPSNVQLIDFQGKILQSWDAVSQKPLLINTDSSGIFFLRITDADRTLTRKIMIRE